MKEQQIKLILASKIVEISQTERTTDAILQAIIVEVKHSFKGWFGKKRPVPSGLKLRLTQESTTIAVGWLESELDNKTIEMIEGCDPEINTISARVYSEKLMNQCVDLVKCLEKIKSIRVDKSMFLL